MAKKKAVKSKLDEDSIESRIISNFGEVFMDAGDLDIYKPKVIPTTPQMDFILSGGIPEGSFTIITGPPKLGKSSMALQIASNAQKVPWELKDRSGKIIANGDRKLYYFDIEGRIKRRDLFSNNNLDLDPNRCQLIKSSVGKIISGEEFLDIGEQLIESCPGAIFIFDSFSALCSSEKKQNEMGKRFRDNTPALLSLFVGKINQIVPVNKAIVIGITHRIANTGMGPAQYSEASGNKIQYQADVKLKGVQTIKWKVQDEVVGQDVKWECATSALGPPNRDGLCKLRYNYGYDAEAELVDMASTLLIIKKKGTWITYTTDDEEEIKSQGAESLIRRLREDPKLVNEISTKVRESLGLANEV